MAHSDSSTERKRKSKRKKKNRSRSRSTSSHNDRKHGKSKSSKSVRRKRSRSQSSSKSRSHHHTRPKSRDRSRSRSKRRESRSRSRGRNSASPVRGRRSRSTSRGHRSRSPRVRGSRSHSKGSDSRSKHGSHRSTPDAKERRKLQADGDARDLSEMTPMEQAKLRMKMALSAAVAADDQLKDKGSKADETSVDEQARFHQAMELINNDSFSPAPFTSSRSNPKTKTEVGFGTNADLILGPAEPTKVLSTESYAHPNLIKDPEESMTRWITKLTAMRQKLLKDSVT